MVIKSCRIISLKLIIFTAIVFSLIVLSCERKIEKIQKSEIATLPAFTAKGAKALFTDSGKMQLMMTFPIMETYNNEESPYSEFRSGIIVNFHDGQTDPVGFASSKYAKYTDKKKLWEL